MPLLSAIAGRLPRAVVTRFGLVCHAVLVPLLACGGRSEENVVPDHRADAPAEVASADPVGAQRPAPAADLSILAPLLERAKATSRLSEPDRLALEQAMLAVLAPATRACDPCSATVSYVDETGGGDHFRCDLLGERGERMADLEVYHRPDLPLDAARAWARSAVAGHPASELRGEHLFVWPGRFEIRAFGRAANLRGEKALENLVAGLPLDALAKL
jgi:hypothetical protein